MSESMPSKLVPKADNKCPDCLYMELDTIQPEKTLLSRVFQSKQIETEQLSLHLLINFNAQWEPLLLGRIKFGLKGGELKLKLTNGKMSYEDRKLTTQPFAVSVSKERQKQKGSKTNAELEPSWNEGKTGAKVKLGSEETEGITDKFQLTAYQVSQKGPENNPTWAFEVETGETYLKGTLAKTELGVLTVTARSCCVEATFEVSQRDVEVIEAEGPWLKDIIPEKRKTLDIGLVKLLLKHKLTPYLSRVELRHVK
jgi:hypothetical protein